MLIEIVTFRLAQGVDEATFLEADRRVQVEFMHQQRGFMRRTTARGSNGEWLVLTLWDTEHDALASAESAASDPVSTVFASMVEVSTVEVKRYTALD